jgi:hypothetical protein
MFFLCSIHARLLLLLLYVCMHDECFDLCGRMNCRAAEDLEPFDVLYSTHGTYACRRCYLWGRGGLSYHNFALPHNLTRVTDRQNNTVPNSRS